MPLPPYKDDLTPATLDMMHRLTNAHPYLRVVTSPKDYEGIRYRSTCIHVADCLGRGIITPLEGMDIETYLLATGYFPMWVYARDSAYSHVI